MLSDEYNEVESFLGDKLMLHKKHKVRFDKSSGTPLKRSLIGTDFNSKVKQQQVKELQKKRLSVPSSALKLLRESESNLTPY